MPAADAGLSGRESVTPDGARPVKGHGRSHAGAQVVPRAFLAARPPAAGAGGHEASARTWVYRHVSAAIVEGLLWPALRLPSARRLALAWGVARGAVDEALMRLAREGLLERRVGRGSFIARRLPPGMVREVSGRAVLAHEVGEALDALAPLVRLGRASGPTLRDTPQPGAPKLMLDPRVPELASFPLAAWRRCLRAAHAESDRASLCYGPPAGLPALREATARHLALTRAIECSAEQVLILNGPLQTIDLVVRVLLEPGDRVVVERPGYMSIARSVGLPPLDLRGAPVDDEGLDVEAARRECPAPALIHVHPLHQYPTGARMTAARRQALLAWARACRAWVIEGDHLGEIVHDGAAPPALMQMQMQTQGQMQGQSRMQGQVRPLKAHGEANGQAARLPAQEPAPGRIVAGEDGQVLFMGTFNGIMFPALRLSYLVVPQRLVPAFTAVRGLFGDHPPLAMQQALCRFIDEGLLGIHMRRMRQLYRQRRDAAVAAAARHLPPQVRLGPLLGGTHGCLHLPAACADEPLAQRLVEAGFGVEMLSTYSWPRQGTNGLVFGYGAEDERGIESGMQQLGRHLYETLAGPAAQAGRGSRAAAGALPSVASRRGR